MYLTNVTYARILVGMNSDLRLGDCLEVLKTIPSDSIDSVVTDPPYGLEFMGKSWDGADGFRRSLNKNDVARENVFGRASRTSPEYRAGSLFQEFTQAWATEVLRVLKPGGHLLAFGGSRTYHRMATGIEDAGFEIRDQIMWLYGQGFPKSKNLKGDWEGWGTVLKPAHEPIVVTRKPLVGTVEANVGLYGTGAINIDGCRVHPDDAQGRWPANIIHDGSDEVMSAFPDAPGQLVNVSCTAPSAARFFYCAKAGKKERGEGNTHPTVKPIALMRYLCRLVTPPGGTVLDPFTGSGSTGIAANAEGFNFLGIEREAAYVEIARTRLPQVQLT